MADSPLPIERVLKELRKQVFKRNIMLQLGLESERILFKRVKSGFGSKDGKKQRLKPLSDSYIKVRKGQLFFFTRNNQVIAVKRNDGVKPRLGTFGTPGKSNLTFTGEMLDNIDVIPQKQGFKMRIRDNTRKDGKTNRQIQDFVEEERPFFDLTESEQRIIDKKFSVIVRRELNKILRRFKL